MKITFLGAASTVTGSKYLLESGKTRFLVDCGLYQGLKDLRRRNWSPFPIEASEINFILLTHAHIDHSGYIPRLVKDGFKGPIYCTPATYDLCKILLPDCAHLMEEEAFYANKHKFSKHKPALPLYDIHDANNALSLFKPMPYEKELTIGEDLFASFIEAGHILGSASILVENKREGKKIGFSGDIGRSASPIIKPPSHFTQLNYLLIESTYGDRLHPTNDPAEELAGIINETVDRGGSLLIPAFAVGRTQSLLYYLAKLLEAKKIPHIPIYIDSPMATNASNLYIQYSKHHNLTNEECGSLFSIARFTRSVDESRSLNNKHSPMIIISASGMATGGRVLYHLERFLPDEKNTVLFTGFQAEGTRGHSLVNGAPHIKIHGENWPVKAKVLNIESISAHADQKELLDWLRQSNLTLNKIFVVHGEPDASKTLAEKIEEEFHFKTLVPKLNDSFDL